MWWQRLRRGHHHIEDSACCWNRANQTCVFVFICGFFSPLLLIYTRRNGIIHARVRSYVSERKRFTRSYTNFTYFVRPRAENLSVPVTARYARGPRLMQIAMSPGTAFSRAHRSPDTTMYAYCHGHSPSNRIRGTKTRRMRDNACSLYLVRV